MQTGSRSVVTGQQENLLGIEIEKTMYVARMHEDHSRVFNCLCKSKEVNIVVQSSMVFQHMILLPGLQASQLASQLFEGALLSKMTGCLTNEDFDYRFGKTDGDEGKQNEFSQQIVDLVSNTCGAEGLTFQVKARGKKFTKVSVEASVESAAMITAVYDDLKSHEMCVMQF